MTSSLFRRVTRYSVGSVVDPRENRLTEVTAAVVEQVDGLAQALVRTLLRSGAEDATRRELAVAEMERRERLIEMAETVAVPRVHVSTQVATRQGRFVDLEILLRPAVGALNPGLLVWVEVKHGADLHGDQLDVYSQDIRLRPVPEHVERVVVLLAPRGWTPVMGVVPSNVLMAAWQSVGRALRRDVVVRPPEQAWLLSEYIRYLKEEGLSDPEALTTALALALMEFNAAWDAVAGICEHADSVAQTDWGARGRHQKTRGNAPVPAFGTGYWAHYDRNRKSQQPSENWRGAWFEWGLRDTADMQGLENTRGTWAFVAGVTFKKDNPTKVIANEQWLARRMAEGFQYFWIGGYYRLARLRYPDELLRDTTLEAQGRQLGCWVVGSFGALADDPPPA